MLPTLAARSAMEASRRASVPGLLILRTRTVRISLRSHAIACSFRDTGDSHFHEVGDCHRYYITLMIEFNSSKDLIVAQSGSGKMPSGSYSTGCNPAARAPT